MYQPQANDSTNPGQNVESGCVEKPNADDEEHLDLDQLGSQRNWMG